MTAVGKLTRNTDTKQKRFLMLFLEASDLLNDKEMAGHKLATSLLMFMLMLSN